MTMSLRNCCLLRAIVATAFLAVAAEPGLGQELKYKPITVKTPDGLAISAQDWGNPAGPEILFIHGFSQSHLSWMRQVDSDLAKEFHIVTYDLRGHGNSDKPLDPATYRNPPAWGHEVQAAIDATGIKRPVLVGWSYAGRVISDYLATEGAGKIAGIDFVDAPIKVDLRWECLDHMIMFGEARTCAASLASVPPIIMKRGFIDRWTRFPVPSGD